MGFVYRPAWRIGRFAGMFPAWSTAVPGPVVGTEWEDPGGSDAEVVEWIGVAEIEVALVEGIGLVAAPAAVVVDTGRKRGEGIERGVLIVETVTPVIFSRHVLQSI